MKLRTQRVAKLGGSLLDLPDLPQRLRRWLAQSPQCPTWLVVGGGEIAHALRRADQRFGLPPPSAHRLAIDAMALNARLLHALLPEATWTSLDPVCGADEFPDGAVLRLVDPAIFQAGPWAERLAVPASWDVTSDSLAARLAVLLKTELVLLKSADPPHPATIAQAADQGLVDRYFPTAAAGLCRIRVVNLRRDPPAAQTLAAP